VLEDALITFRFAENLAHGQGFAFNPGERVLGTTTPLFTLLLAGLGAVFGTAQIPLLAFLVSLASAAAGAWFLIATVRAWGLSDRVAALVGLAFVLHPDVLWSTAGGMETALVLLSMAMSLWALTTKRWAVASVAAALLVLTRPDGLIWAPLAAALVAERRSAVWRESACSRSSSCRGSFATLYFGSRSPIAVARARARRRRGGGCCCGRRR
jgi:Gpi18-like mannosyltransferase